MIVRVSGDAVYRLPDEDASRLNELDNEAVSAVEAGDEARFTQVLASMIDLVRSDGEQLPDDDLSESDAIIPPADLSYEEASREFTGDGLIPD